MRSFWAVLALSLIALPDVAAQEPDITIDLRVLAHATLNRAELDRARETATALLATGGMRGSWRECTSGTCEPAASASPHSVTVLLLPIEKLHGDDICGEATRDALTREPTVLVYVRSIVDRVRTIHRSSTARSHPTLLTLQSGHLAGIAIAHEVGHALGLGHAPSGVMKAQLGIEDLLEWRRSGLAFSRIEATTLRAALLSKSGSDPVVERIREHRGSASSSIVRVVGPKDVPRSVWQTVKHLAAYRIHRPSEDGGTVTDAAIYLVRTSDLYHRAANVLRTNATGQDDVWCLLAAVLTHEAAHTAIDTEREALKAQAAQLRDCVMSGHLSAGEVVRLASSLSKIDAKVKRFDREMPAHLTVRGDR